MIIIHYKYFKEGQILGHQQRSHFDSGSQIQENFEDNILVILDHLNMVHDSLNIHLFWMDKICHIYIIVNLVVMLPTK